MEEVILRFSHLGNEIFILLDNESISKCQEISKVCKNYLDDQRFLKIRKMRAIVGQFHKIGGAWKRFFDTASKANVMDLSKAVGQFYKNGTNLKYFEGLTPLHVTAGTGNLQLFQTIRDYP